MPNNNNTQRFQEIAKKLKANLDNMDTMLSSLEKTDKDDKTKEVPDATRKKIKKVHDTTRKKIKKVSEQIDNHSTQIEQYSKDLDEAFKQLEGIDYSKLNKKDKKCIKQLNEVISKDLNDLLSEIK